MKPTADPSVSLLARLKNEARRLDLPLTNMLLLYAQQGFLARLDMSEHAERFVLKGVLSLFARYVNTARPTRDIDLAASGLPHTPEAVEATMHEVCAVDFSDHLTLTVQRAEPINEGLAYPGVGVQVLASVGRARQTLPIDVSFGNVITPGPVTLHFPDILLPTAVPVRVYPLETVIAEKFAALVELNITTTRMKDVYDLSTIAAREVFDSGGLQTALARSFAARGTPPSRVSFVFGEDFVADATLARRWSAYLRTSGLNAPDTFQEVMTHIQAFLAPLFEQDQPQGTWNPNVGRWQPEPSSPSR